MRPPPLSSFKGTGIMEDELVESDLSQTVARDGTSVKIEIHRLEHEDSWVLEVVDETGASTVWDDRFATDQAALDEAMETINKEGIWTFIRSGAH